MPADTDAGAGAPANPLLTEGHRVPFDTIAVEHYVPAVRSALDWAREELEGLKSTGGELTYDAVLGRFSRLVEWPVDHCLKVLCFWHPASRAIGTNHGGRFPCSRRRSAHGRPADRHALNYCDGAPAEPARMPPSTLNSAPVM